MPAAAVPHSPSPAIRSSVHRKLLNVFAIPGEVFDEVVSSPSDLANWRVPTLLVCLVGIISLQVEPFTTQSTSGINGLAEAGAISAAQTYAFAATSPLLSALSICIATFAGSCWSAFVLWLIGRAFLKISFPFIKALEIVGLTGIISVLGSITTTLLIAAFGDPAAQPALSFLVSKLDHGRPLYQIFATFNFFYLWSTTLLAIGLSRLCNVTFKEAAFWVFGYWVAARIVLGTLR